MGQHRDLHIDTQEASSPHSPHRTFSSVGAVPDFPLCLCQGLSLLGQSRMFLNRLLPRMHLVHATQSLV